MICNTSEWHFDIYWKTFSLSLSLVAKSGPTLETPWTVACQAFLSMGFSRQECWSGLPFSSPGDLLHPGIKPESPALQADAFPSEPPGGDPTCSLFREGRLPCKPASALKDPPSDVLLSFSRLLKIIQNWSCRENTNC